LSWIAICLFHLLGASGPWGAEKWQIVYQTLRPHSTPKITYFATGAKRPSVAAPRIGLDADLDVGDARHVHLAVLVGVERLDEVGELGRDTVDATLDVILPQERTQLAATAATIQANGLASKEWVRSEVMGISNNDQMEKQIAQEKVADTLTQYYMQKMMNELQMQDQMKQQQQQADFDAQQQRNQQAMQAGMQQQMGYDMGGAQNIPVGQEQSNPALQAIQAQAMANNMPQMNMPQVPEGNLSETAGIAGGMPSEMMGMIPQLGA
jgi:hypothetical protein